MLTYDIKAVYLKIVTVTRLMTVLNFVVQPDFLITKDKLINSFRVSRDQLMGLHKLGVYTALQIHHDHIKFSF